MLLNFDPVVGNQIAAGFRQRFLQAGIGFAQLNRNDVFPRTGQPRELFG